MNAHDLRQLALSIAAAALLPGVIVWIALSVSAANDPEKYTDQQLRRIRIRERQKWWNALIAYTVLLAAFVGVGVACAVWIGLS